MADRWPARITSPPRPGRRGGSGSGQLADRLLEQRYLPPHALVHRRADDAEPLDDHLGAGGQALEAVAGPQSGELLLGAPGEDEPGEIAAVGLDQDDLEALDRPGLLLLSVPGKRLVEDLEPL